MHVAIAPLRFLLRSDDLRKGGRGVGPKDGRCVFLQLGEKLLVQPFQSKASAPSRLGVAPVELLPLGAPRVRLSGHEDAGCHHESRSTRFGHRREMGDLVHAIASEALVVERYSVHGKDDVRLKAFLIGDRVGRGPVTPARQEAREVGRSVSLREALAVKAFSVSL
eukprot:scaffold1651_cov317-Pinguiococcus_pyrenoidosus.AAC.8